MDREPRLDKDEAGERKKNQHHTSIYLDFTLEKRLNDYLLDEFGSTYGRNNVILQAIEEYLERHGR